MRTRGGGRARMHRWSTLALAAGWLIGVTGCSSGGWDGPSPPTDSSVFDRDLSGGMVSPRGLAVHPLSRVAVDGSGVRMILHLELRDEFNQSVKSLGRFRVAMDARRDEPDGVSGAGDGAADGAGGVEGSAGSGLDVPASATVSTRGGQRQFTWALDLSDPRNNARYYDDLVTRTYTVALVGLPAWVREWATEGQGGAAGQGPTVRVWFEFVETPTATAASAPGSRGSGGGASGVGPDSGSDRGQGGGGGPGVAAGSAGSGRVRTLYAEARIGR